MPIQHAIWSVSDIPKAPTVGRPFGISNYWRKRSTPPRGSFQPAATDKPNLRSPHHVSTVSKADLVSFH